MAKGERDWRQLESFEAEYSERLTAETKRRDSLFLRVLSDLARGRGDFFSDELKARDEETRRLFALRGKIRSLREKLGTPQPDDEPLLDLEKTVVTVLPAKLATEKKRRIRFIADTLPPGLAYPVTFDEIRALLAELPPEHTAPIHEIRLSNQKNVGADGDWLEGEIRLHCAIAEDGKRLMGRHEGSQDVIRFGGKTEWGEGNKLYAVWPLDAYKIFVLRRVLVHEVAHGVAELPGFAERVRSVGSIEKFCEQYAENFYRPPGKSVRIY